MRKKNVINYPNGFPYILFEVAPKRGKKIPKYTVAATEQQAMRRAELKQAKALPVSVKALIDQFGHQKTHELLAQHGKRWMCKEGKVFFQELA